MNDTPPEKTKLSWWRRLSGGLKRTSSSLGTAVADLVTKRKLDRAMLDDIEDVLLRADLGTEVAARIAAAVGVGRYDKTISADDVKSVVATEVEKVLAPVAKPLGIDETQKPFVILVVGVNGSGKTTTIGKLAAKLAAEGRKVMLAAGDTFRAAAIEQLKIWGERTKSPVIAGAQGSDSASLAFNALTEARGDPDPPEAAERPGEAVIVYFGDGATSQGDVNEAFVWASVFNAPIVFFCQNNQWAISEPLEKQSRIPLYQRARGFGFPGLRVDGNDVLACYAVTKKAMQAAREGQGPTLIEAFTYRMGAHTTTDDPTRYRLASELEMWKLRDPIERVRAYLVRTGLAGPDFFAELDAEAKQIGARVREACRTMPDPPPLTIFDDVYSEPTSILLQEREQYAAYLDSFAGDGTGEAGR